MQMNDAMIKPMITNLQAQMTQMQQMMNTMHQAICQSTQQLVLCAYPQTQSYNKNDNQQQFGGILEDFQQNAA